MNIEADIFLKLALSLVRVPYLWGGKNVCVGVDCSGLMEFLLKSQGMDPIGVQNAQMLYDHFSKPTNHYTQDPTLGALVFYGSSPKSINHVGMCLTNKTMIESAGGDHTTTSLQAALEKGACVRVSPIRFKNSVGIYLPEYSWVYP